MTDRQSAQANPSRRSGVRLVVLDVDGCLTPGEGRAWDWRVLEAIQGMNRRARAGEALPAVTLCTGRQEPYVEALMQGIDAHLPAIFENGCGLYDPIAYRFAAHPAITPESREALDAALGLVKQRIVRPKLGYLQPGKYLSLSVYPLPGTEVGKLLPAIQSLLDGTGALLTIQASVSCVDITPAGVDKGAGVRWLAKETGTPLACVGGVGDSPSDLPFLSIVGRSAAPCNAAPVARSAVGFVSPFPHSRGVMDILEHWRGVQ